MKTLIIEGLKAKFPGISNSIITGIADKLAKTATTEEEATTATEGVTFQTVLDFQATSVSLTAKLNYEKKHNLKDGKPIEAGDDKSDPAKKPDGEPEIETAKEKAAREKYEKLEARLNQMDGDKVATSRKKQLDAAIAKGDAAFKARYEKSLGRMTFKDDEDFNSFLTEVQADTEAFVAAAALGGSTFKRPMGGGGGTPADKPSPEVEARIKAREAETVAPAIVGLPTNK